MLYPVRAVRREAFPVGLRGGRSPGRFPRRRAGTHLRRSTQVRVPAQAETHRDAAMLVEPRLVVKDGSKYTVMEA